VNAYDPFIKQNLLHRYVTHTNPTWSSHMPILVSINNIKKLLDFSFADHSHWLKTRRICICCRTQTILYYIVWFLTFIIIIIFFHFFIEFKTLPLLNKEFHIIHKWNLFKKVELFSARTIIISSNRFRGKKLCPTTLVIIPNFSSNYIIAKTLKYHE